VICLILTTAALQFSGNVRSFSNNSVSAFENTYLKFLSQCPEIAQNDFEQHFQIEEFDTPK
jgi:hypothetical protein